MSKVYFIFIISLLSAITPWLGFPSDIKKLLSLLCGIIIAIVIVYVRQELRALERVVKAGKEIRGGSFVENGGVQSTTDPRV